MALIVHKIAVTNVLKATRVILIMDLVIMDVKMVTLAQSVWTVRFLIFFSIYDFTTAAHE